jgi:hypothetical protein
MGRRMRRPDKKMRQPGNVGNQRVVGGAGGARGKAAYEVGCSARKLPETGLFSCRVCLCWQCWPYLP